MIDWRTKIAFNRPFICMFCRVPPAYLQVWPSSHGRGQINAAENGAVRIRSSPHAIGPSPCSIREAVDIDLSSQECKAGWGSTGRSTMYSYVLSRTGPYIRNNRAPCE